MKTFDKIKVTLVLAPILLFYPLIFISTLPEIYDVLLHRGDKIEITQGLIVKDLTDYSRGRRHIHASCQEYTFKIDERILRRESCYRSTPGYSLLGEKVHIYYYKNDLSKTGIVRLLVYKFFFSLLFSFMIPAVLFALYLAKDRKAGLTDEEIISKQKEDYRSVVERKARIQRELEKEYGKDKDGGSAYN